MGGGAKHPHPPREHAPAGAVGIENDDGREKNERAGITSIERHKIPRDIREIIGLIFFTVRPTATATTRVPMYIFFKRTNELLRQHAEFGHERIKR